MIAGARLLLGRVPRWAWLTLAGIAVVLAAVWAHSLAVKRVKEAAYNLGVADEGARIAAKALQLKVAADELAAKVKDQNNEANRASARTADTLRVHGPGKAACPGYPSPASGPVAASGPADAAGPEVPADQRAAVPWPWLVDAAEQCDLNRNEVLSWREWHAQLTTAWSQAK